MAVTKKVTSFALTEGSENQLNEMQKFYGENRAQVIQRAIAVLHFITFNRDDKK